LPSRATGCLEKQHAARYIEAGNTADHLTPKG